MKDETILKTGIIGSVIAAICCATPVLVITFGALGLSAWIGGLDYVLLPSLALFLVMTGYGLWRRRYPSARCDTEIETKKEKP